MHVHSVHVSGLLNPLCTSFTCRRCIIVIMHTSTSLYQTLTLPGLMYMHVNIFSSTQAGINFQFHFVLRKWNNYSIIWNIFHEIKILLGSFLKAIIMVLVCEIFLSFSSNKRIQPRINCFFWMNWFNGRFCQKQLRPPPD